jgi:methylated-DNA-[protein]-cysteine S-methyltransferase
MTIILADSIETPVGVLQLLAKDGVMLLLEFEDATDRIARELRKRFGDVELVRSGDPFGFSTKVRAYFHGDLSAIDDIPTDGGGTPFQRQVWAELRRIPAGTTISYGELALRLGDPNLMRAVGVANAQNPIAIVVPCHRVIGADGSMTGYGGGIDRKIWLLAHEGVAVVSQRVSKQADLFSGQ